MPGEIMMAKALAGAAKKSVGQIVGAGQMISGLIKRKKADAQLPAAEDPMMRQTLSNLQTRGRQLSTGTANNADRVAARQMAKTMASSSFKTGGKANMGVQSAAISQALGNINAQNREQVAAYDQMAATQSNEMAQRKSDINMLRSERTSAQAENSISAGRDNFLAGYGMEGASGDVTDEKQRKKKQWGEGMSIIKGALKNAK
jgi:hypothetical protein